MKKNPVLAFGLLLVLGFISHLFLSWVWFLPLAAVVGFAVRPSIPGSLFWSGFLAGAIIWASGALFYGSGGGELPARIAELFGLGSALVLGIVISIVGGLSGGLFMVAGAYLRATIQGPKASLT